MTFTLNLVLVAGLGKIYTKYEDEDKDIIIIIIM